MWVLGWSFYSISNRVLDSPKFVIFPSWTLYQHPAHFFRKLYIYLGKNSTLLERLERVVLHKSHKTSTATLFAVGSHSKPLLQQVNFGKKMVHLPSPIKESLPSNTYQEAPLSDSMSTSVADLENFYMDPKDKFISFLSSRLQRIAESNDHERRPGLQKSLSFFDCTRPCISLQRWLERIVTHTDCSPACFVVAYIYLDRLLKFQPSLSINSFNVQKLVITSIMVASKFMEGLNYSNSHYAKLGGMKATVSMNLLEKHFLFGVGFRLYVTPNTFSNYLCFLHKEMLLESPPIHASIALSSLKVQIQCSSSEDEFVHQDTS